MDRDRVRRLLRRRSDWLAGAQQVEDGLEAMGQLLDAVHRDMVNQDDGSQAALDQVSARIVERLS